MTAPLLLEALVASAVRIAKYACASPTHADAVNEGSCVMYSVITNLIVGHPSLTSTALACAPFVKLVLQHSASGAQEAVELLLLLAERQSDDLQVAQLSGASPAQSIVVDWSVDVDAGGSGSGSAVSIDELCAGLLDIQKQFDHKSVQTLRSEQCLAVLQGRSGQRGVGLSLWK